MFHLLNEDQAQKLAAWMQEQDTKVAARQNRPDAYYGASGGAYTYKFTPTTLGLVIKVENGLTKEEIDLTEYDGW